SENDAASSVTERAKPGPWTPPLKLSCASSATPPLVAGDEPPDGPSAHSQATDSIMWGCHANRSMRARIWRKSGPVKAAFGELQRELPDMIPARRGADAGRAASVPSAHAGV